jgi:hypothetical protein
MNFYEEKQQRKLERFSELAEKNKDLSESKYNQSSALANMIPFGQPILVGHHSEKGHRRALDKIHNLMGQSIEAGEKAEYYEKRAENIQSSNVISSDNPDAINLLKEKLTKLEERREAIKSANKKLKSNGEEIAPAFMLQNLAGNIRTVKLRIQQLEKRTDSPEIDEQINGIRIFTDKEQNRVQLFFPDIPSEDKRSKLKHNGFRWSPFNKCWQRQTSNRAIYLAKQLIQ